MALAFRSDPNSAVEPWRQESPATLTYPPLPVRWESDSAPHPDPNCQTDIFSRQLRISVETRIGHREQASDPFPSNASEE